MKWERIGSFTSRCGRYVVQDHGYHWGAWFNRESVGYAKSEDEAKELCEDHERAAREILSFAGNNRKPKTLDQWIDEQPLVP